MTKARRQADLSLSDAERRLDRLGSFRRERRTTQLIKEMDCSRDAIRIADERLTSLDGQLRDLRSPPRRPEALGHMSPEPAAMRLEHELEAPAMEI